MKVHYIGVNSRKGVSVKTNRPYEVSEFNCMVPDKSGEKRDENGQLIWEYTGLGFKVMTIDVDPACLDQFRDVKPGSVVDIRIEPLPNNMNRNQVVGLA